MEKKIEGLPAAAPDTAPAAVLDDGLSPQRIDAMVRDMAMLEEAHKKVLKRGPDYDKLPGTQNPCLYQPGAQKLAKLYNLGAEYEYLERIEEETFLSFSVRCILRSRVTGRVIGSGLGSCNSRENKYRWRWEATEKPVPKSYWKAKGKEKADLLGGKGLAARKDRDSGQWVIHKRVPNNEPWDLHNTLLKMAEKRAFVKAVLESTAASHLFVEEEAAEKFMREADEAQTERYDPKKDGPIPAYDAAADRAPPPRKSREGGYISPKDEQRRRDVWGRICALSAKLPDDRKADICQDLLGEPQPNGGMPIAKLEDLLRRFQGEVRSLAEREAAVSQSVDKDHAQVYAECATVIGQLQGYDVDLSAIVTGDPQELPLQELQDLREILRARLREEQQKSQK